MDFRNTNSENIKSRDDFLEDPLLSLKYMAYTYNKYNTTGMSVCPSTMFQTN